MSNPIVAASQDFAVLRFDATGPCVRAERLAPVSRQRVYARLRRTVASGQRAQYWWPRRIFVPLSLHSAARRRGDHRTALVLHDERRSGTLLPFVSLLLGIAAAADAGHAS